MKKAANVINYYCLCNQLKNLIHTGWKIWHVQADRLESVAEHIFSAQMLAIAMQSEYQYQIDLEKVILMLAIHDLGEIIIDDLTQFDISKTEKTKIEHVAVHQILQNLLNQEKLEKLFLEYDAHETAESKFAYQCDKLDGDLQSKIYYENNYIDLEQQEGNRVLKDPQVSKLFDAGYSFPEAWFKFSQNSYHYDKNFLSVSNYAMTHQILSQNGAVD